MMGRNAIIASALVLIGIVLALFLAALTQIQRTTPLRMEEMGSSVYYEQVMADHMSKK